MVKGLEQRYDIAIVGSGPAGLSAAINAKIRNKNIILFGSDELGGKLNKAPRIDNYLGLYGKSGSELKEYFSKHISAMDIVPVNERINAIYAMGDYFALMVNEKTYEAKAVILASGVEYTKSIKGEEELLGKGVGYCATCDAPLYRGKSVAIIGYNKKAEEEADFVNELVSKLYYIPMYRNEPETNDNIKVIRDKPVEIKKQDSALKLVLQEGELEVDGVFVLKDSIPPAQLVPGLAIDNGHIKVDRNMKTNIPGCFAAGDCTGKPYQYMKAAGEGQVAALNAVQYLDGK